MNTITITFEHLTASTPAYSFGDRVAVAGDCQPNQWPQGLVVGLYLEEKLIPQWFYAVRLDLPQGFVEEYHDHELVPESFIHTLQAEWEIGEAAWMRAHVEVQRLEDSYHYRNDPRNQIIPTD